MNYQKQLQVGDKVTYDQASFIIDQGHRGIIKSFSNSGHFAIVAWNTPAYQGDAEEWAHNLIKVN